MSGLHKNEPKVYKKYNIIDVRHKPKGEAAHNQAKQDPKESRIWTNPNKITSSLQLSYKNCKNSTKLRHRALELIISTSFGV